jgi:hypothetical protein
MKLWLLERSVKIMQLLATLLILTVLVSGIWNSVWAASVSDPLYRLLHRAPYLRSELIGAGAVGISAIIMTFTWCIVIYLYGRAYLQLGLISLGIILALFVHVGLVGTTIWEVSPGMRERIRLSLVRLFRTMPAELTDWMSKEGCRDLNDCGKSISHFLSARNSRGFYFNAALVAIISAEVVGLLMIMVVFYVSGPEPESAEGGLSEERDTAICEASMTDRDRQKRDSMSSV